MEHVGVRGHVTFRGRLTPDAKGFPASAMAKTQASDWRDPDQVRQWAKQIVPASAERARRPESSTTDVSDRRPSAFL